MSSYNYNESQELFRNNNKTEITTTFVEVESLNGKEFTENSGKIDLFVPPNIQYLDPSQSYLTFDIEIENSDGTPLKPISSISSLFRSIRIYSAGASGKLLEEIDNYSNYVDVLYQYTLNLVGDKDKKSMTELCSTWNEKNEIRETNTYTPFLNSYGYGTDTENTAKTGVKQRCQVPLHTGIFRNSNVFANALIGGLRIEIQLRSTKEAFITNNPNGDVDTYGSSTYPEASGTISAGTFSGTDTIKIKNNFRRGIQHEYGASCLPFSVGQQLQLFNKTDLTKRRKLGSLTEIQNDGSNLIIKYNGVGTSTYDFANTGIIGVEADTITGTYKMSNVKLVCCEISPPDQWKQQIVNLANSSQGFNYDIITATNYIDSVSSGNTAIVSKIPINNTRCKSIITAPVKQQIATYQNDNQTSSYDRYVDYQYFYLNQNQPNELIPLDRVANDLPESIHLDQVKKSIEGCDYPVNNLREFKNCFVFGRGLSYGKGSLNLADGKDVMLKINTDSSGISSNTLLNHYVVSVRRIRISNGQLEVFY